MCVFEQEEKMTIIDIIALLFFIAVCTCSFISIIKIIKDLDRRVSNLESDIRCIKMEMSKKEEKLTL